MECIKMLKILLFFLFFLLPILCKKPFGINPDNLAFEYCRLFFDPNLDHCARSELSAKISAILISENIEIEVMHIDMRIGKFLQNYRSLTRAKMNMSTTFEEYKSKLERKKAGEKFGMADVCQLWSSGEKLRKLKNILNKDTATIEKEHSNEMMIDLFKMSLNPKCKELANIERIFELNLSKMPQWIRDFRDFVSLMNFNRLNEFMKKAENAQQSDFSVWANFKEKIEDETQLSNVLRHLNGRAEIDQIMAMKKTMNRYLMDQVLIGKLELQNPLTMAFEIKSPSLLKSAFRGMAIFEGPAPDEIGQQNKNWLLISLQCGKILDYFVQLLDNKKMGEENGGKTKEKKSMWKLFTRLLPFLDTSKERDDKKGLLLQLDQLLDYLRDQFGEQKMSKKWQMMVKHMEQYFFELYEEEGEFRRHLHKNIVEVMTLLKDVFDVAEETGDFISLEFWTFLDKILNGMDENSVIQSEEENTTVPLLIQCPCKNIPLEKLKEEDSKETKEDFQPILMISLYKNLLLNVDDKQQISSTEIDFLAMILSYKINIHFLLNYAVNFLEDQSEKGTEQLDKYVDQWNKKKMFSSNGEELCEMHKLANSIAKNSILMEEHPEWEEFVTRSLNNAMGATNIPDLILASESAKFRWSERDCADEDVQGKLIIKLLKQPNAFTRYHFMTMNSLIKSFTEIRHFFCYGTEQIGPAELKEHFRFIFGDGMLGAMELNHPIIMHFEATSLSHRLLLFLEQLRHQTDSPEAEMAEARINAPILVQEMRIAATKDEGKHPTMKLKAEKIRELFYRLLVESQMPEIDAKGSTIRNSFCVLCRLFEYFNNTGPYELHLRKLLSSCSSEANVKRAIAEQRERIRERTWQFVQQSLALPALKTTERIKAIQGARTRLWKLLYKPNQTVERNEQEMSNLWEMLELSDIMTNYEDSNELVRHYENALLRDGNDLGRIEGKMKADIFILIHWMGNQFTPENAFSPEEMENVQIYWPIWVKMFDSFYDQLFDEQGRDEMEQIEQDLIELITHIKGQVQRILEGQRPTKSETEVIREWRRRHFVRVRRSTKTGHHQFVKAKHCAESGPWMRRMHGQMLVQLIGMHEQFKQKLKNDLENSVINKYFLFELLDIENTKEVLNILGINYTEILEKFNDISELFEGESAEKKGKNKTKKKKNVKRKKEKLEENEEKMEENSENLKNEEKTEENSENLKSGEKMERKCENLKNEEKTEENCDNFEKMEESNENLEKEKPKLERENLENIKIIGNLKAENTSKPIRKEENLAKITDLSPEKLDPNEFVGIKLGDFEDDQFLTLKYGEFVQIVSRNLEGKSRMDAFPVLQKFDAKENWENCDASAHSLVRLLHIGILANEIWHYILTMKALNGKKLEGKSKNWAKMEMEWAQLRKVKLEEHITSKNLEQSLFMLLKQISVEGFAVKNIQNLKLEKMFDEIGQIRQQLHQRKFAIAFFKNERILDKNRRKIIWSKLFKEENEEKMNCLIDKMEKYLILNEKLNEQIKIDKDLFMEYRSKFSKFVDEKVRKSFVDSEKWTLPDEFAKTWQEIKFGDNLKLNLDQKMEIEKYLTTNGYLSKEEMSKKQQIMGQLSSIVKGWCPEATVHFAKLILESEMLESICILSEEFDKQLIVGRLNCETSERTKCADLSLYCVLCTHSAVKMPKKTDNNQYLPPLLKMEFHFLDVPVEMTFIFVPIDKLPASAEPVDLGTFQTLTKYFAKNIEKSDDKFEMDRVLEETKQLTKSKEESIKKQQIVTDQKAMLVALTKNFMNEKIFEILSPVPKLDKKNCNKMANERGDVDKLRIVLAYLEMWAKNNFIFGTEMGYLNLPMLLIMAAKVFLMFPEASVPFLIEKYFLIYSKWKWPIPVQLAPIKQKERGGFLSWSPDREWKQFEGESAHKTIGQVLAMPIISPLFPEQNEANLINLLTAKVIHNELKMAFVHLRNMNDSQLIIAPILDNKKFAEKYDHFVIFICGGTENNAETFCHFVGKRLRHELLLLLVEQSFANLFNFFHVYPKLVHFEQSAGEPKDAKNEQKRKWLIGLKLHKQKRKTKPQELFTSEMIEKLAEIDIKIKNDFEKDSLYKVNLKSEYVERSKVDKWNY